MMKLAYTIIYVPNVPATLEFFNRAFQLETRFLHESNTYGELDTGATCLAFANMELAEMNFGDGVLAAHQSEKLLGFEIALSTDEVAIAHANAIAQGASEIAAPVLKPWGQTVSYVRSPDGLVIELCTPINH